MFLHLNNKSEYLKLIDPAEDFYQPDKPLPKVEVRLPRVLGKDIESDEMKEAIKNLVWLNRYCDRAFLSASIPNILKASKEQTQEIIDIVKKHFIENENGKLVPEYSSGWYIITKDGYNGTGKHKALEQKLNVQKISDAISDLKDGYEKITQQMVCDVTKLSIRTVKARWSEFKEEVREFNSELKIYLNQEDDTELQ